MSSVNDSFAIPRRAPAVILAPAQVDACARALRNVVMDGKSGDNNWEACRPHYVADFQKFRTALNHLGLEIMPKESA